jgi:hypothetical protein
LQTFDVETISRNTTTNRLLATRQQIKIWRKDQILYVTFFADPATNRKNQHHEFDIRWFKPTAQLEDPKTVVLAFCRGRGHGKTGSHSEENKERRGSVTKWVRRVLSSGSANEDATQDPAPEISREELSFPRSVIIHNKDPEPPLDHHRHLLNWGWLKIEFTNDGGQFTFAS